MTFLALFFSTPSFAQDATAQGWQVVSAAGDARYRLSDSPGTPWHTLSAGEMLSDQAQLETGAGGRAILQRNGDRIAMSPNSRILLPESGSEKKVTTIFQSFGVMLYKVRSRARSMLVGGLPARRFEVRTPYLVSTVKGTTFSISVNSAGAAVNLIEGILQVSNPDNSVSAQILGGQIASVARDARNAISVIKVDGTGHQVHRAPAAVEARAPAATGDRASQSAAVASPARTLGTAKGQLVSSLAAAPKRQVNRDRAQSNSRKAVVVVRASVHDGPALRPLPGRSKRGRPTVAKSDEIGGNASHAQTELNAVQGLSPRLVSASGSVTSTSVTVSTVDSSLSDTSLTSTSTSLTDTSLTSTGTTSLTDTSLTSSTTTSLTDTSLTSTTTSLTDTSLTSTTTTTTAVVEPVVEPVVTATKTLPGL